MPEIPRFRPKPTTEEPAPTMGGLQPAVSLMRTARQEFVRGVESVERGLVNYFEKEKRAKLAVKSEEAENAIDEDMSILDHNFDSRIDYENWPSYMEKELATLEKKYTEMAGGDKDLDFVIHSYFRKKETRLRNSVRVKTANRVSERGVGALVIKSNELEKEYVMNPDPKRREEIIQEIKNRANALVEFNILNPVQAEQFGEQFEKGIQQKAVDFSKATIIEKIRIAPKEAYLDLHDPNYLPDLKGTDREQAKNTALSASKVQDNEIEKRQKEAEKLEHDNEDREIANLFMAGDLKGAFTLAQTSKRLTGDEKRVWANAIDTKSKKSDDEIDPVVDAINYNFINELISREVDPNVIKKHIYNNELKSATRQKLIDRVDTEKDSAVNKERTKALSLMKSQIMPGSSDLMPAPPLQALQYNKAMNALDDWVSENRKAGKPISANEMRIKALELSITFSPSVAERQEFQEQEFKEFFEGLKKKKEGKVETKQPEQPTQEKYELNKIYTDAQGRKAKYLGGGKWQLVK